MDKLVHLHLHSNFSLLDGLSSIKDIVSKVKEFGQNSVALTDHGSVAGLIEFYKECKKNNIKSILGMEAYFTEDCQKAKENKQRYAYHIILLAMNNKGFNNLIKLATASNENFYYKPRIDFALLEKHNEGLIVLTACMHGVIAYNLFDHKDKDDESIVKYPANIPLAECYVQKLHAIFGDRFYLEVQDGGIPEQQIINARMRDLSKKFNIPTVATIDAHYINQEDSVAHTYLKSIAYGAKTLTAESGNGFTTQEFYIKKRDDLKGKDILDEELDRTIDIATRCNVELEIGKYKLPKFDRTSDKSSIDLLKQKINDGWYSKLTKEQRQNSIYKDRLDKELMDIKTANLADYFLIVADIVNYAKSQDWWIGPGRGSVGGSLCAYLLNITTINPIKYDLIWERFFNIGRKGSMADIDIDVEKRYRDNLIEYIKERFGHDRVTQLATFNKLAARAVLKDVFKVAGISFEEANRITSLVPMKNDEHAAITLDQALEMVPELRSYEDKYKSYFAIARKLEGAYKSSGTHAAAVVIANESFSEGNIPLAREPAGEGLMCAWDMKSVEDIGLLKIDILGLSTLEVMHRCVEEIKRIHNIDIDVENLLENDSKTWQLFEDGQLEGVFQLETQLGKNWSKKIKPQSIEELADILSLIRPATLDIGMPEEYRAVKFNEKQAFFLHKNLEPILARTNGVSLYQEQMLEIAKNIAGYSLQESDILRRACGKKDISLMKQQKDKFINGIIKNNYDANLANQLWELVELSAGYSFNKSHAIGYSMIAFRTAWLKANYTTEFCLANLTVSKDNEEIARFINDAKISGIEVKPPSLKEGNVDFEIRDGSIIYGLSYIKSVGEKALTNICSLKDIKTWSEFLKTLIGAKINKQIIIALISSGALDYFSVDRSKMKADYGLWCELTPNELKSFNLYDKSLLDFIKLLSDEDLIADNKKRFGKLPNVSRREKLRLFLKDYVSGSVVDDYLYRLGLEKFYLGIAVSGHETDVYQAMSCAKETCMDVLRGLEPDTNVDLCILIEEVKSHLTKSNQEMAFLKGSDNTGSLDNLVVFPKTYARLKHILEPGRIVSLWGCTSDRGGVICNSIKVLK